MRRILVVAAVRAAGVILLALFAHVLLDSFGADVPMPALLVGGLALLALVYLISVARPPAATQARIGDGEVGGYGYPDRPFVRARHWQERLDVAEHDADRRDDPDRARNLLGPRVWAALMPGTDAARRPTVGQLSAVLDDLEAL
jgi:hypothetical protein